MPQNSFRLCFFKAFYVVLVVVISQLPVHAQPAQPPVFVTEPVQAFPLPEILTTVDAQFGIAVRGAKLDRQRGGNDPVNNNMQLNGSVRENVANNVTTGSNTIDSGSFANISGIPTVIQNSGANVLIQNAMIINLQFK